MCAPSPGQVDYSTATLKGTIFDPQELPITNARIIVSNPSTGWSRVVEAGGDGVYRVPLLPPGTYKLLAQATGFATAIATVSVSVGQIVDYDIHLKLGSKSEIVEVKDETPLVQVEQTQQANTIGQRQIAELPNLSHLFTDSVFTLPGVYNSEAPRSQVAGFSGFVSSGFSVGGGGGRHNLVTIDGGENDMGAGALRNAHVPADSVQEFQVNRSSFAAEFGFTAGTAVNVVTRSGSNQWHGSAHGFFGDQHTDAANYFALKTVNQVFEQNLAAGFNLGGPLLKDKLFLFTAFEFIKIDTPQFRSYATSDAAQGIRSNTAQQEYLKKLPDSLGKIAVQLQSLLDPANFPNAANLLVPNSGAFNDWKKYYNSVTRIDYQPTANDTLTGRFSFMEDDGSRMDVLDPSNSPDDATIGYQRDYTILAAWNHIFTPKLVNQLRVQTAPNDAIYSPVVSPHTAYLRIAGLGQFGGEHYQPFSALERRFQFEDSLALSRGKHTLKFGASYRPFTYDLRNELWFAGEFQFLDGAIPLVGLFPPNSDEYTALVDFNLSQGWPPTGNPDTYLTSMEAFDLGLPVTFRQAFGNPQVSNWEHYFGAYAQDSWKALRNLTIDFGGRVDFYAAASPLLRQTYFSPRLGSAWSPGDHKTVIRGGGGIFVAPVPFFVGYLVNLAGDSGKYLNQVATNFSKDDQRILTLWGKLTGCNPLQPWLCAKQPPFPQLRAADLESAGLQIGPGQPNRVVFNLLQPYKNNYSIQASLSVERQLSTNTTLELAYHMSHGVHIQVPIDTNVKETGAIDPFIGPLYTQIHPDLTELVSCSSIGNSIYHGLMASLTRRFSHGLQFQANYTFSKAIDDNIDFNNDFMPFRPTRMRLERSPSAFDIRHNFVANAVYTTPFQAGNNLLSHILADFTIAPVLFVRSGIPFTVRVPGMQNGTLGESLWARPWHAGRNTGIGPSFYSLDLRISKSFYFNRDGGRKIDFLVQGTNILNHTNFSAVNDSFPADPNPFQVGSQTVNLMDGPYSFHGIRGLDASQPLGFKAAFDPRHLQFGLKLIF
ncbi:MAG: carboxypeptidase regulatory-like domain-containing protein [Acidobacteriia bacterium]|nr:carboxypeptidase regulatory-like domain-containing protein [Terriglobia bacterium]